MEVNKLVILARFRQERGDDVSPVNAAALCRPPDLAQQVVYASTNSAAVAVKYAQSGWWKTSALTLASGSIIMPSVN